MQDCAAGLFHSGFLKYSIRVRIMTESSVMSSLAYPAELIVNGVMPLK